MIAKHRSARGRLGLHHNVLAKKVIMESTDKKSSDAI
jgi:hypothetical protein